MSDEERSLGVTVRSVSCPETLEFALVRFGVPSLECPEKFVDVEITVDSPDQSIPRVIEQAQDILIERIEFQLAEAKRAKENRLRKSGD